MTGIASTELLTELEAAAREATPERRARILQRVTELFLSAAANLNTGQVSVFDDVLLHLMERMEPRKLAELSAALADAAPARKRLSAASPARKTRRLRFLSCRNRNR